MNTAPIQPMDYRYEEFRRAATVWAIVAVSALAIPFRRSAFRARRFSRREQRHGTPQPLGCGPAGSRLPLTSRPAQRRNG
jgi:hypothetical protein